MQTFVFIAVFGLLGIFSRYGIDQLLADGSRTFPLSTFLINFFGSMAAGAISAWSLSKGLPAALQSALLVGFCGGFTTFSAYALQSFSLIERGRVGPALLYLTLSPLAGIFGVFLSFLVVRRLLA